MGTLGTQRGFTLIEVLLAASLLLTLAGGMAGLLLLSRQLTVRAEQMSVATLAASAQLERLRAVPWRYDPDGSAPVVAALAVSPPGALDRDVDGFHERLDASGRPVTAGAGEPRLLRRWAIEPGADAAGLLLEVCVFAWPAAPAARPLVCLASARGRQP